MLIHHLFEELEQLGMGKWGFATDPHEIARMMIAHIDKKRAALGLPAYDPTKFGASGDARMNELLELPLEERIKAAYGMPTPA